ncbi:spindle pole body component 110-like isoform X1 [Cucurbita moschata]|uniref:Spindle pole body component 110-like isoform X1 n=1 Tax=Cucurbita moschata TaxID=3662 RepID=A0A6J1F5T6_CUCMO|nr:spindle pole body component 110-like isoform X1 [Cucurbita moschata]
MFRLHKNRQANSKEKYDFKLSNFKAIQVPKGWDKLFVSVTSEQTGKTIVRTSKGSVRNGSCQWSESISESISVSQDEPSKEFEDFNYKLVVAMGSSRSSILGEAMINLTDYTDPKTSSAVLLPLNKCNHGTILQVKIQCVTPISKVRSRRIKQTNSLKDDLKKEGHDSDSCSDITDSQVSGSIGSSSGADLYSSFHSGDASSTEASYSASDSHIGNDSSEAYDSVESDATKNNYNDIRRQDSVCSQNSGSAETTTTEELRAEARMWESNARKLMADLDQLKKEFSDQSENQKSLHAALSAATAECDGLRKELEELKPMTEKSTQRQTSIADLSYQDGETKILDELKDELKFQKESNADLALQLKRSQESNIELVSVLKELEEINENQKLEIEELLKQQRNYDDYENINQENKKLMLQLEHVKESEQNLQLKIEVLERNLEETKLDLQKCEVSNQRFPQGTDGEYDSTLHSEENLVEDIERLKEKVQELEKDCNELTEENMNLLYKLKQANNDSKGGELALNSTAGELLIENNDDPFSKNVDSREIELEVKVEELSRELTEKKMEIEELEHNILSKDDEIKILEDLHNKLQAEYSGLQKEKNQMEEQMEVIHGESDISARSLNDLRNEVNTLSNSVDLHISANKILESKYSELQCEKQELELHISQIEQKSTQLSESISVLESQLKYMTDEKESIRLELENFKSEAVALQDEVDRQRLEIETESVDLKQMLNDLQNKYAEAQDKCEYLQREKTNLEAAAEHLSEERNFLRESNGELKKKNFELHEDYFRLESKLKESLERSAHYFIRVDDLEDNLFLGLEDLTSKERFLSSELDSIVEENIKYKEKCSLIESLYNETYLEKTTEVQELQAAVVHLTMELSATRNDLNVMESNEQLLALISELSVSKKNQEKLMADHEELLKQLENHKSLEVKLKNSVDDLELKLSFSEKERKQHEEELTYLKRLERSQFLEAELKRLKEEKQIQRESSIDDSGCDIDVEGPNVAEAESIERIQLLEKELAEVLEANKKYEDQLSRVIQDDQNNNENSPIPTVGGDVMTKEGYESINSALEEELRDLRERYFHMSLKYAEVEQEREELVLKLRAPKSTGRSWFS